MLKKNYEFKNVLNRGKYFSGKYIAIFIRKNNKNMNFQNNIGMFFIIIFIGLAVSVAKELTN